MKKKIVLKWKLRKKYFQSVSVQLSHSVMSDSLWTMDCNMPGLPAHHQLPEFTQTHAQWQGDAIQPSHHSVIHLSSCPQSFPMSGSFKRSQLLCIGVSASASVLPVNIQDWFPLGWTGWISLLPKGFSRVFSNTTVQKHQFFCAQLSL